MSDSNASGVRMLLLATLFVIASCADDAGNPCLNPPGAVGAIVQAEAASDPCTGQPALLAVSWFIQGGARYPLRCGRRDDTRGRGGYGYLHIRYDATPEDTTGHGDPVNDPAFAAETARTLAHGAEAHVSGGTWRYTDEYTTLKGSCTGAWGFRVVLAKSPNEPDGHPAGVITALRYLARPQVYP